MPNRNPYTPMNSKKSPPPPPKATDVDRKDRLGLHDFTYHCTHCQKKHKHSSGYMFVVMLGPDRLYFCNVNCCDDWEKANPELKARPAEPVTDRRGAIAATKAKNAED